MSSRGSLHRRNVWSGNCPFGEMSVGEVSVGELTSRGTVCIPIYTDSFIDLLKKWGYNKALTKVSAEHQANLRIFYYEFVQWDIGDHNLLYITNQEHRLFIAISSPYSNERFTICPSIIQ